MYKTSTQHEASSRTDDVISVPVVGGTWIKHERILNSHFDHFMSSTASFSAHAQRPAPCNVSTDANLLIYTMLSELHHD